MAWTLVIALVIALVLALVLGPLPVLVQRKRDSVGRGRLFVFPSETCSACPQRERCVSPQAGPERGRTVFIVDDDERLIREHSQWREHPEFQARLAQRAHVERVIAEFPQYGGKQARRFGSDDASLGPAMLATS